MSALDVEFLTTVISFTSLNAYSLFSVLNPILTGIALEERVFESQKIRFLLSDEAF